MFRLLLPVSDLFFALTSAAQDDHDLQNQLDTFWKSKKMRAQMAEETADFHPGDTIADIGTADGYGWFALALAARFLLPVKQSRLRPVEEIKRSLDPAVDIFYRRNIVYQTALIAWR